MPLVANYDSSDEDHSSGEEDDAPQPPVTKQLAPPKQEATQAAAGPSSSSISSNVKGHINFFEDDDEEEEGQSGFVANLLPKPREGSKSGMEVEEVGPIPPKKIYGDEEELQPSPLPPSTSATFHNIKSTRTQGSKIQITAPSLKDFEDEDEDKGKSRRYIQPSKKGSGLFSILPEPKGIMSKLSEPMSFLKKPPAATATSSTPGPSSSTTSSRQPPVPNVSGKSNSLVPDSVRFASKRPPQTKLDEIRAKYLKQEANVQIVSRSKKPAPKASKDSDDSDEEEAVDFFSLDSASKDELDEETFEKLKLPPPVFQEKLPEPVWNTEQDTHEDEAAAGSSTSQPDMMQYVKKKKGKGKAEDGLNFIEVKADDLRSDSNEWIKNITDESAIPTRKFKGPGGMQKKKHQITYLAFEAKAREQELQAQWAHNRATKRQTQMKYGF